MIDTTYPTPDKLPSVQRPWLKYFPTLSLNAEMPKCSLYSYIKQNCDRIPQNKAIHYYGTSLTYAELLQKVDACAAAFTALGVKTGDIVSFVTVTLPETIYAMYALNRIGAICNFVDPRMDVARIHDAVAEVKSNVLITIDIAFPKVKGLIKELGIDKTIVQSPNDSLPVVAKIARQIIGGKSKIPFSDNILNWKRFSAAAKNIEAPFVPGNPDDCAVITYTGGTTGSPKGVMLTNLGMNAVAESFVLSGVDKGNHRFLDIMPVFASYGVVCGIHMPLAMGFEDILIPKFDANKIGELVYKYRPGHMMGVPSFYERLMHSKKMWDFDLSFLLTTGCGGDTMNPGLESRFNNFMKEKGGKYPLSQGYGMSELSSAATCCFSAVYKDDSAGIPLLAVTAGIFEPGSDKELGYNVEGEICMTGPTMMKGYYENQEETDNIMLRHSDGNVWIHSGDIGYMDEDGFIYIKGRIKQIIIRFDGHKVFPVQIESIIGKHKAVGTCAVVGIPDPDRAQGMLPLGIIELKGTLEGPIDTQAIRKEIMAMCDTECEERGKPADIVFIDEIPHTLMGKNDYIKLSKLYKDYKPQPWQ